jgi:hypothetical protein
MRRWLSSCDRQIRFPDRGPVLLDAAGDWPRKPPCALRGAAGEDSICVIAFMTRQVAVPLKKVEVMPSIQAMIASIRPAAAPPLPRAERGLRALSNRPRPKALESSSPTRTGGRRVSADRLRHGAEVIHADQRGHRLRRERGAASGPGGPGRGRAYKAGEFGSLPKKLRKEPSWHRPLRAEPGG